MIAYTTHDRDQNERSERPDRRSNMFKLKMLKKAVAFVLCSALAVNFISSYTFRNSEKGIEAKTIAELQEERKANEQKIAELEQQISQLENNKEKEQQYQQTLSTQIDLVQKNILIIDTELTQITSDIQTIENNINTLNQNIIDQQANVDANIEIFKERLCAMYITGSDSLALAVLGSSDFYDLLSRMEMMNSIAAHDEELVQNIKSEINDLETSKSTLETEKLSLVAKKEQQESKRAEKETEIDGLNTLMKKSQDEIDRIALEADRAKKSKEDLEKDNDILDQQEADIKEQIRIAEEKKRKEDAEKAAQAAANQGGSNNGNQVSQAPTYVQPSVAASGFAWPVPGYYYISSPYGTRWGRLHAGIDISGGGISGAGVVASKSGTVISVSCPCSHNYPKSGNCCGNGYGNYVMVQHDGGYTTLYGHLSSACVSVGDHVSQGQVIGYVGSTGHSTGYHLHFEVRSGGVAQNPKNYV